MFAHRFARRPPACPRSATSIRTAEHAVVALRTRRYKSSAPAEASSSSSSNQIPTTNTNRTRVKEEYETPKLPYLPHPVGIPEPPTTLRKTWREETMELMDQDVRLARRRHIIKEASKGYFSDLNATRKLGGKTWIAPPTLIRAEHALYFPDVKGMSLASKEEVHTTDLCKGKVSIIAMLSTAISEEHIDSFVRPTNSAFLSHRSFTFLQINLQENPAKAFLVFLYLSSLRRNIPKQLHPTYLLSKQNMEYLREPLGMNNRHIGFVYLVDWDLKVRWAGGGLAIPEEAESLRRCTKVLLERMENMNAGVNK